MSKFEICWSDDAEKDLDALYEHYLTYAPENAKKRVLQIIIATEELVFSNQWQVMNLMSKAAELLLTRNSA